MHPRVRSSVAHSSDGADTKVEMSVDEFNLFHNHEIKWSDRTFKYDYSGRTSQGVDKKCKGVIVVSQKDNLHCKAYITGTFTGLPPNNRDFAQDGEFAVEGNNVGIRGGNFFVQGCSVKLTSGHITLESGGSGTLTIFSLTCTIKNKTIVKINGLSVLNQVGITLDDSLTCILTDRCEVTVANRRGEKFSGILTDGVLTDCNFDWHGCKVDGGTLRLEEGKCIPDGKCTLTNRTTGDRYSGVLFVEKARVLLKDYSFNVNGCSCNGTLEIKNGKCTFVDKVSVTDTIYKKIFGVLKDGLLTDCNFDWHGCKVNGGTFRLEGGKCTPDGVCTVTNHNGEWFLGTLQDDLLINCSFILNGLKYTRTLRLEEGECIPYGECTVTDQYGGKFKGTLQDNLLTDCNFDWHGCKVNGGAFTFRLEEGECIPDGECTVTDQSGEEFKGVLQGYFLIKCSFNFKGLKCTGRLRLKDGRCIPDGFCIVIDSSGKQYLGRLQGDLLTDVCVKVNGRMYVGALRLADGKCTPDGNYH